MRRSSRSVCANIGEAWRKRRYPAHFASKLCDSEGEGEETRVCWNSRLDVVMYPKRKRENWTKRMTAFSANWFER
jgi:four helix bundle protein